MNIPFETISQLPPIDASAADTAINDALKNFNKKIVVLDDDPTGVQTVHDVFVYTNWEAATLREAFEKDDRMFFILTNSRSFTSTETVTEHQKIAERIVVAAESTGRDFLIISRSDSTLRGHYPLEPETLKNTVESLTKSKFDGEIIIPFFLEGGRYTIDNIHYVKEGELLIPAGETEFARDKSFGYKNSHLGKWCEEKNGGKYRAKDMVYISIDELRSGNIASITDKLLKVSNFNKVIVNSADYCDVKVFSAALIAALNSGKRFMIRSAAAITKVLGGVSDKPLLTRGELISPNTHTGGIIIVGSHVNKTTKQLEELKKASVPIEFIEFNQHLVLRQGGLEGEVERVVKLIEEKISSGKTVAVYTRRERFDLDTDDKDEQLKVSVKISNAVTSLVSRLQIRPRFIIAKGGITSSDIGTKALKVRRALVMGQISPGIPVWMTGDESKFPNMPYIIFPGNVGETFTLREIVEKLS